MGSQRAKMWVSIKWVVHLGDMGTSSRLNSRTAKGTFTVGNIGRAVKNEKKTVPLKSPTTINKNHHCARSHNILPNPPDFLMFPMKKMP